ncbi:MAG: VOC family protein [Deltaproteobacteria bacterium]|nr:VOC family protein [Deltaproteobacteria bacterium]
MIIDGIQVLSISVKNMEESLAFFQDWIGMELLDKQSVDSYSLNKIWNLPECPDAHVVYLKKKQQPTIIALCEFKSLSRKPIREKGRLWDYGLYNIAFSVKDIDSIYRDLTARGFEFIAPPVTYKPRWVPFSVKEAILIGPGEMPIAHIELLRSQQPDFDGRYGRIMDSAQVVESMEEAISFYRDVLGLELVGDHQLPRGLVDEVLGLPQGTDLRMAFLNSPGSTAPLVELIEFSRKGVPLDDEARPPNLGLFMLSMETDDLPALIKNFRNNNILLVSEPVALEHVACGAIEAVRVLGPGKVMLEFFQKASRKPC